jgi:protein MpaA
VTALGAAASTTPARGAGPMELGRSVRGRPIVALELSSPHPRVTVLVVGCIHGNEPAGIAVIRALARMRAPEGVALWLVPDLNPDGVAADTRQNADGVDLNRNFPTRWRPQHGAFESGPRPLSEPEARIAYALVLRLHPLVSIWFHQHADLVDDSSGDRSLERRFAAIARLPLAPLPRYGGSAVTWESRRFPGTSPFVVELPGGRPSPAAVSRYARAVLTVAALAED